MPYTEKQIAALDAANLYFTNFDWNAAQAELKECLRTRTSFSDTRYTHIAYSLFRGRPIVGKRGIEHPNTREPVSPATIQYYIDRFQKQQEAA